MRIILFSRAQLPHTARAVGALMQALRGNGLEYTVNEEFAPVIETLTDERIPADARYGEQVGPCADQAVMVCYGGDGTLLEGVRRLGPQRMPVVGINAGHLGFLSGAPSEHLDDLFARIAQGALTLQERALIEVSGDLGDGVPPQRALNEFAVQRYGAGMIAVEAFVDGKMIATYRGDGVIVSTPTGSTGYSLSAGGPVVDPACRCLILTPLASHNITMRPVVIPDTAEVRLRIHARNAEASVTIDTRTQHIGDEAEFTLRRAEQTILLAVPHNISFYDTLRNKMMWGVDLRS